MNTRLEQIRTQLVHALAPLECALDDESAQHIGHAGAASGAGHYKVRLVSTAFEGKNRLSRHRLIYDALQNMMPNDIHALTIVALTPLEAAQ